MKYLGAHVSIAGGVENAPLNAAKIEAKAFAMFTRNQRQWLTRPLTPENIKGFKENCEKLGYKPFQILAHDSYLINMGNPEELNLKKSREAFTDEMQRCEILGLDRLNFHPGSHLNLITSEECMKLIAVSINMALEKSKGVAAVIENTAGQGSNLGFTFEQIKFIIDNIEDKSRAGVCIDTCHTYSGGYDIKSSEGFRQTFDEFDRIIGFQYLKGVHMNDSKKGLGSKVDRHENIGKGFLGTATFEMIMNDKRFDNIPLILETPDESLWEDEIRMLYSMVHK
jgi:deoxyribonuclease-4